MNLRTPAELQSYMRADYPLSPEQFEAVTAPLAPAVIIAGAGSGKTTLMAARVAWLIGTGQVRAEQVLGLTFTNKAAGELSSRIRKVLRDTGVLPGPGVTHPSDATGFIGLIEPTVATYNAYAGSLLIEQGLRIGHEPDTRVIADASRYQLAARAVAGYRGRIELLSDSPRHVIGWILALDSQLGEHLRSPAELRDFDRTLRAQVEVELTTARAKSDLKRMLEAIDKRAELLGLVEAYREIKHAGGLMEFSDQIERSAQLAEEHPEVGATEREKYRVVLLDEYQDTSVAQARFLRALFGGGHPVMAVGDPNQAIYGWRGASVSNILRFGEDFPNPDGSTAVPVYSLTVNRRSDRRILEVANMIAEPLNATTEGAVRLQAPEDAADGEIEVAVHLTYDDELAALPDRIRRAHAGIARNWGEIAVLTRDNGHAADVFHALTLAGIPVEIVGLKGLLELPEVSEVVATLSLLHDLTDNAALLTLLAGPRWAIGPRDLALLGKRASHLAGGRGRRPSVQQSLEEQLAEASAGVDPSDVASLSDALEDPGEADYSPQARTRFTLLAEELRTLRRYAAEPLLDLVRRIIDTTGIDIELASSNSPAAGARRDNLDLFVSAVAEFQAIDGAVTLAALLSWLEAEDEFGSGLDVATPTESDSVKLLTVHRAKGLEYDAVFLVGAAREKFPSKIPRSRWVTGQAVLPNPLRGDARDLPTLAEISKQGITTFIEDCRTHDLAEECRLAYVAITRPRRLLEVSSYVWASGRKGALGPSPYQEKIREAIAGWGAVPLSWHDVPDKDELNPVLDQQRTAAWPTEVVTAEVTRRRAAAELVRAAVPSVSDLDATADDCDLAELALLAEWDAEIERLVEEVRARRAEEISVRLPATLSATTVAGLRDDPDGLAEALSRPTPRRPSPAARFGTRFHAFIEEHFKAALDDALLDPDELPGRADVGITGDDELRELRDRFLVSRFAELTPIAIEPAFSLMLAGQMIRGRIDAIFPDPDHPDGVLVIDWKTNRQQSADPVQLAIYRLAWAELRGLDPESVRAAFYYLRDDALVVPENLPGRAELEAMLAPEGIGS